MLAVLEVAGGKAARDLVSRNRDPAIEAIVASWPARWDDGRARALGFQSDESFAEIVRSFIDHDLRSRDP
jgi:hypothetical protein